MDVEAVAKWASVRQRVWRFRVGRALIHAGLAAFPSGRAKDELSELLWQWGTKVRATIAVREYLEKQNGPD